MNTKGLFFAFLGGSVLLSCRWKRLQRAVSQKIVNVSIYQLVMKTRQHILSTINILQGPTLFIGQATSLLSCLGTGDSWVHQTWFAQYLSIWRHLGLQRSCFPTLTWSNERKRWMGDRWWSLGVWGGRGGVAAGLVICEGGGDWSQTCWKIGLAHWSSTALPQLSVWPLCCHWNFYSSCSSSFFL